MKPKPIKSKNQTKRRTTIELGDLLYSEIPEWLQEFKENLVDDEIPVQGDSHVSSSHEASLEPLFKRREEMGKHSFYTHFPKTEIARSVEGPKLQGPHAEDAVPWVEKFGDLITADHKDFGDKFESRNNHRYAVVLQDLATQWIQAESLHIYTT